LEHLIIQGLHKLKDALVVSIVILFLLASGCKKDDAVTNVTTGTINGTVVDASSSAPLSGASVATSPPMSASLTDVSGKYVFANVNPGAYTVTASRVGYTSGSVNVTVTAGGTSTGSISLAPAAVNRPPNQPGAPSPVDNATNQTPSLTLSWICSDPDSDTLTYDVFFGTSNPPTSQVATGQSGATLSRTGLSNSTTYYWKVNATDSKGATTPGTVWSFTTSSGMPPPGMVLVTGGTFQMGSASGESNEQPVHAVTLGSYYLDSREVTVAQYLAFCTSTVKSVPSAPSWGWSDDNPIVNVTWDDATAYAVWAGKRLPTEAEWEYAARGGALTHGYAYSGSNTIGDVAWYESNSENRTHAAGTKASNELGLYDMSGNLWEWCSDWYDSKYYSVSPSVDPKGPAQGSGRVLRGGSYYSVKGYCRVAIRDRNSPTNPINFGFRCAKDM
jgi:formylglycine-generating enzyme